MGGVLWFLHITCMNIVKTPVILTVQIFRPADLLGPSKDMAKVMVTLQLLYSVAVGK